MKQNSRHKQATARQAFDVHTLGPIEQLPTSLLKAYASNARKHDQRQITLIMTSIEEFGFNNPIIAEEDGTIIAGHGRWEAAKKLGLQSVPVLLAKHLTPDKVRAYRLADNRLAELSGWDSDMLTLELSYLDGIDLGFSIETLGWEHAEIDVMLNPLNETKSKDCDPADLDVPTRPANPVSQAGDLWLLGEHRLLVGSSLEAKTFETLMDGRTAAMVFQDAPYNVPINGHVSGLGKVKHKEFAMASGEMSDDEFRTFLTTNLRALTPHLRSGSVVDLCMDWRGLLQLQTAMVASDISLINLAVWIKTNGGMGSLYRSQHELVLIGKFGKASPTNNVQLGKYKRYRTNVWRYAGANSFGAERMEQLSNHPTPKPIALVADAIRDVSNRGEIILDSFMGSGTTLLAAERTGRIAYGIDIDPGYVDVCIERWQKMTGREAVLSSTGESFAKIQVAREIAQTEQPVDNENLPSEK